MNILSRLRILACGIAILAFSTSVHAFPIYFQGFETDVSGWSTSNGTPGDDGNGSITRVAGTMAMPAADGAFYALVHNDTNGYLPAANGNPGYGSGGYSFFGFDSGNPLIGGAFSQSIGVYIDTSLTQPVSYGEAYWIDMSPSSTDPADAGSGGIGYGDEQNFRLVYSGSSVAVSGSGTGSTIATITTSGWYNFTITYQPGSNPTDLVTTTMSIADFAGNQLGSLGVLANQDGETLQNQYLSGPGYAWLTVWQNGFSGDQLAIDDVRADSVPEPTTLVLIGSGLVGMILKRRAG